MLTAIALWFRTNPKNIWLIAGLVGVIAVLLTVYMRGRHDADARNKAAHAVEVVEATASDAKADSKGSTVAQQVAASAADRKEELINVVAPILDTAPDNVAVATGCIELCDQGTRVADLPACAPVADKVRTCPRR